MMAERGVSLAHTTIMRWIQRFVPEFKKRWNRFACPAGTSWCRQDLCDDQSSIVRPTKREGRWISSYERSEMSLSPKHFSSGVHEPGSVATQDHALRLLGVTSGRAGIAKPTSAREAYQNSVPEIFE
jgi:hypothetical protein